MIVFAHYYQLYLTLFLIYSFVELLGFLFCLLCMIYTSAIPANF